MFSICRTLVAGNLGEDRKDIGMMIKSFLNTFKNQKNPPALILKTSSANFSIIDRREIKKIDMVKKFGKLMYYQIFIYYTET